MRLTPHKHYVAGVPTKFMSENETVANAAWDAIEAGHGDVAIDPKYAAKHGLPPTIAHPRDPSKLFYIIESYHSIHCLVRWLSPRSPACSVVSFPLNLF